MAQRPRPVASERPGPSAAPAATPFATSFAISSAARFIIAFAMALIMAQTLGLLHGIVHSPPTSPHTSANTVAYVHGTALDAHHVPGAVGEQAIVEAHGFLAHLFFGHLADADCHAYDQLSHFDAAPGIAAVVLPLVLTPFLLSTLTGLAAARWHALFQARGPPSLR